MKTTNTPKTTTTEESKILPHTDIANKELASLLDTDFSTRIQNHRVEWKKISRNGHMKSFDVKWKKIIAIVWENKEDDSITNMPNDIKARYGAVIEWYRMISEYIYTSYLPDKPPYGIRYPKALAYKHTDKSDLLIIEWVDGLVSFDDINRFRAKIPNEHINPIKNFLDDWDSTIEKLSIKSNIRSHSKSTSRFRQFTVDMSYGNVIVESDFGIRLNGNGVEEETLHNCGYILGKNANEKPVIYLTDGLIASSMKPKT